MFKKILLIYVSSMFIFAGNVFAHPGNTDASGGHTCRMNCGDWGLYYGEYHYHDDSGGNYSDSQADYDAGYSEGYDIAYGYASKCQDYEYSWEGTQNFGDGFEDGIDDGHSDGLVVCEQTSYDAGYNDASYDSENGIEYDGLRNFKDTYQLVAYGEGYSDGYDEYFYNEIAAEESAPVVTVPASTIETAISDESAGYEGSTEDDGSDDTTPWKGFATVMTLVLGILSISKYIDWKDRKRKES
jgi:hypothetical protein